MSNFYPDAPIALGSPALAVNLSLTFTEKHQK